jgi:hypothetical protein
MLTKTQQAEAVLVVLYSMKDCIDNKDTFTTSQGVNFNLRHCAGICWHVFAHTPSSTEGGCGVHYLEPIFEQFCLDSTHPIERQFVDTLEQAADLYWKTDNLYAGEVGEARYKLLTKLIEHFEKVIVDNA